MVCAKKDVEGRDHSAGDRRGDCTGNARRDRKSACSKSEKGVRPGQVGWRVRSVVEIKQDISRVKPCITAS